MKIFTAIPLALLLGLPVFASAQGRADLCYSAWSASSTLPTNNTVFVCPVAGSRTIGQLASQRWKVRKLSPMSRFNGVAFEFANQLLIQEEWIYRSGFDN